MTSRDHASHRDDVGAYLLGALTDLEREAFEQHLAGCPECRDEVERLHPAAASLPRSVEQVEPPPGLKDSLMEVVEREARERSGRPAPRRRRLSLPRLAFPRPLLAAVALALGLLVGVWVADEDPRTEVATVDEQRVPGASARLQVEGDGENGAILRVQGMPSLEPGRVYQAWVQRDGPIVPQPTFEVGPDGDGAVAIPDDVSDAAAVMVT
ncbi:MAG TPA: anti-sigma factor, partial [Thermoleophilaceae bacterium]|nr:anti-sigma factor [Thermoleophilaceae bacterium]